MKIIKEKQHPQTQTLGYGDLFEDSCGRIYMICQSGPGQIMLLDWSEGGLNKNFNRVWDPVFIDWRELNTKTILEIFSGLNGPIKKSKYNLTLEILND